MRTIYLKSISSLLLLFIFSTSWAQSQIKGVVKHNQNNSLPGANIVIKGT